MSYGKRGYEVILKRDTDEIYINYYNNEYLIAWDSNIDIQICLDYFAVITYILDYKMKDESGTLEEITKALKGDNTYNLRQKLSLVAHTFITHHKAGESEIMYKLFPFLHLTHSNIGVMWLPTGFKDNMSRMLCEISEEEAKNTENLVKHDDKLYTTKENLFEKYLDRHEKVSGITYTQFAQRYEVCKNPNIQNYDLDEEFYDYLVHDDSVIQCDEDVLQENEENELKLTGTEYVEVILGVKMLRKRCKPLNEILDDDFIFETNSEGLRKKGYQDLSL